LQYRIENQRGWYKSFQKHNKELRAPKNQKLFVFLQAIEKELELQDKEILRKN
jgi:hypothetical protein